MRKNKKLNGWNMLAVISLQFVAQTSFIVNAVLANIAEAYPDVPYSLILMCSTVTALVSIPSVLVSGFLAGRYVKYRTISIITIALVCLVGIIPYFTDSFTALFASRIIVGICLGMTQPFTESLIIMLFDKEKQAFLQGIGLSVENTSGIIFQFLAGILCVYSLKYVWLLHLLQAVTLVLVIFFLPEPKHVEREKDKPLGISDMKIPFKVHLEAAGFGIMWIFVYPLLLQQSSIIMEFNIGTSVLAGAVGSAYTIGGFCAGLAFGKVYEIGKRKTIPVCLVLQILILLVFATTSTGWVLIACSALTGVMIFTIYATVFMDFARVLKIWNRSQGKMDEESEGDGANIATSAFNIWLNVGAFGATLFITGVYRIFRTTNPRIPLYVGAAVVTVITVIWTAMIIKDKKEEKALGFTE